MSATVITRRVRSTPHRTATTTWQAIIDVLAPQHELVRQELLSIAGIAGSVISDEVLKDHPIVVWGNGPRLRLYCLYGEQAIEGETANENALTFSPTEGTWQMSIPTPPEDRAWIDAALKKRSSHIVARDINDAVESESSREGAVIEKTLVINQEAFNRS